MDLINLLQLIKWNRVVINNAAYCQRYCNIWIAVFCCCRRYRIQLGLPSVVPQLTLLLPHHSRFVLILVSGSYCMCAVCLYMACDNLLKYCFFFICASYVESDSVILAPSLLPLLIFAWLWSVTLIAKWVHALYDALCFK